MLCWSYTLRSDQNTKNSAAWAQTLLAQIGIKFVTWSWGFQWVGVVEVQTVILFLDLNQAEQKE
jgi:hypothetical protein